jgi:hypothetical protein
LTFNVKLLLEPFSFFAVAGLNLTPSALAGGVTVTAPVNPPLRSTLTVTGITDPGVPLIIPGARPIRKSGPIPSSMTVKLTPEATEIVLVLLLVPGLASRLKATVPVPKPGPEVICTKESESEGKYGQVAEVVTMKLPGPPLEVISWLAADSVYSHALTEPTCMHSLNSEVLSPASVAVPLIKLPGAGVAVRVIETEGGALPLASVVTWVEYIPTLVKQLVQLHI